MYVYVTPDSGENFMMMQDKVNYTNFTTVHVKVLKRKSFIDFVDEHSFMKLFPPKLSMYVQDMSFIAKGFTMKLFSKYS